MTLCSCRSFYLVFLWLIFVCVGDKHGTWNRQSFRSILSSSGRDSSAKDDRVVPLPDICTVAALAGLRFVQNHWHDRIRRFRNAWLFEWLFEPSDCCCRLPNRVPGTFSAGTLCSSSRPGHGLVPASNPLPVVHLCTTPHALNMTHRSAQSLSFRFCN